MKYDSFRKPNNLQVQYVYMTSVHRYMFLLSAAILRGHADI